MHIGTARLGMLFTLLVLSGCGEDPQGRGDAGCVGTACIVADASTDGGACPGPTAPCASELRVVSAEWLAAHLDDAEVQVVDVRGEAAYAAGHVPGALRVDVAEVRATVDGVSGQVADGATVTAVLSGAGLRAGTTVVAYDGSGGLNAARLLWTLEHYGHGDVRWLDGGWTGWLDAGRPTSSDPAPTDTGTYVAGAARSDLRVDVDWMLARLDDPAVTVVDVRSASEYEAGHVPGALHVPWGDALAGTFLRPEDEVATLYGAVPTDGTVVTYCTTGTRASMGYWTLRWLGHPDVRVYDGSWAEWGALPDTPKTTGPDP